MTALIADLVVMFGFILYMVQTGPEDEMPLFLGFAVIIVVMLVVLLQWLASVGDTYEAVRSNLLSPGLFLLLAGALDRQEPKLGEFARHSLDCSVLGFSVYGVTMTTGKLLYLLGSMAFLGALEFIASDR